ncbi:TraB/GumN family protein [Lysobacter sp. CFH 32150]|uniref:TraB/GumN family protein n=1 Tax=Lysobacter sp. CFH 32150 TaxID=2927128 RepID=UPI0031F31DC9
MRPGLLACLLVSSSLSPAFAQSSPGPVTPASDIRNIDTVVVTGSQPGPGMWKVSKGDHVMWVLGTVSPLPSRMEWQSSEVERVIARADEVIWSPAITVSVKVGFFSGLLLAPKALGARKNPDGETLAQVVPADMYARWQVLKRKYVGRDGGIEQWRPLFAAIELYDEAIKDSGLRKSGVVGPVLQRAIKARKPKETNPAVTVVIADPKAALTEFRASKLDDMDCFAKTLQRLETDLDAMRLRANAWAIGDIAALRALPYSDQSEACDRAATETGVVRKRLGIGDLEAEKRSRWLQAAEQALANNAVTFAVLPMREFLKTDGYIAALQARGYAVEAPE